jgi:hypothetical protein
MTDHDVFSGIWKMNPGRSSFDPNHRPTEGTMRFDPVPDGYVMHAEGVCDGKPVTEHPMHFVFDGREHPVPGAPGMTGLCSRPEPNTIQLVGRMGDRIVGEGRYVVSADGRSLTTTVRGIDAQQREFDTTVVWERGES